MYTLPVVEVIVYVAVTISLLGLLKLPVTTSCVFGCATPPVNVAGPVGAVQLYCVPTGSLVTEKLKVDPEQVVKVNCPTTV